MHVFHGWDDFYLMIGSAAGALIGLLFVVITLTAGRGDREKLLFGASLYMTPTLIHFSVVLGGSALATVPGLQPLLAGLLLGGAALVGLGNAIWSCIGINKLSKGEEKPHHTDFWMYGVTPALLYLALGGVALCLAAGCAEAVPALAAALTAILFWGVRNAWDLITWIAPGPQK